MKIIITGALGHIGSYIARDFAIQFQNSEIILIDNMLTQRYSSLFNLPNTALYNFIEADVNSLNFQKIIKNADVIIHLAAITDATSSFDKLLELEENNYKSTQKLVELCSINNIPLIAISSTSVYGTQNEVVSESCKPEDLKPQSPYAFTKLKEERLIQHSFSKNKLKAVICRFGTIFGTSPGMRFHTAVNKFCWQAVMNQPITIWREAYNKKRPYLDIRDASNALSFIIKNRLYDGAVYNILTLNSTVKNVVEIIKEFIPKLEITYVDNKIMNQLSYEVSNDLFISRGFSYSGNIKNGIRDTIQILKQSNSIFKIVTI